MFPKPLDQETFLESWQVRGGILEKENARATFPNH